MEHVYPGPRIHHLTTSALVRELNRIGEQSNTSRPYHPYLRWVSRSLWTRKLTRSYWIARCTRRGSLARIEDSPPHPLSAPYIPVFPFSSPIT